MHVSQCDTVSAFLAAASVLPCRLLNCIEMTQYSPAGNRPKSISGTLPG